MQLRLSSTATDGSANISQPCNDAAEDLYYFERMISLSVSRENSSVKSCPSNLADKSETVDDAMNTASLK